MEIETIEMGTLDEWGQAFEKIAEEFFIISDDLYDRAIFHRFSLWIKEMRGAKKIAKEKIPFSLALSLIIQEMEKGAVSYQGSYTEVLTFCSIKNVNQYLLTLFFILGFIIILQR